MNEEQALGLLDNTVSQVQLSRGDHARLVEAVRVLKSLVDSNKSAEATVDNETKKK